MPLICGVIWHMLCNRLRLNRYHFLWCSLTQLFLYLYLKISQLQPHMHIKMLVMINSWKSDICWYISLFKMTHQILSCSSAHLTQSTWYTLPVLDEWMRMVHRWNASDEGTPENSHNNLYCCHFVHTNPTRTSLGFILVLCSDKVVPVNTMEEPTSWICV